MSSSAITGPVLSDVRRAPAGTAAAPSFAFNDSTGTGVYLVSAGVLGLSTNGAQRVVVDASGNVGIGTASPATLLDVSTGGARGFTIGADSGAATRTNSTTKVGRVTVPHYTNSELPFAPISGVSTSTENTVEIGSNTSSLNAASRISFYTGATITGGTLATERMRIDASGNLLVGTTSGTRKLTVSSSDASGNGICVIDNSNAGSSGVGAITTGIGSGNGAQNNTSCWHFRGVTSNVGIWYLYGNGTSSFTSDERLKKNIEPARRGYLEDVCKLEVVKYNWKSNEEGSPKELGLIAQQVEQVFPSLVQEADVEFEGGLKPKVLKGSVLPFMLLKAIQEQQEIIEKLEARLAALESK